MKNKIKKIIVSTCLLVVIVIFFSGCGKNNAPAYAVDLEIWGVFDDSKEFNNVISEYKKISPFIRNVKYKKFTVETYKEDLIDALATGNGPDIFLINNAWIAKFEDKVSPAPEKIINEQTFRDNFVDIVADDFLGNNGEIYAVPLSVDSLALYYNKDLLNAAGITSPPKTWDELMEDVKLINKVDEFGAITRSGVALGSAYNINRSSDIIDLLMFQNGANMPSRSNVDFKAGYGVGRQVMEFYTQFARSSSPVYSWNNRRHYSLDEFYEGDLAMMLNYSWHIKTIKNKNAKLNFGIAELPQVSLDEPVTYANYWAFAVNGNKNIEQDEKKVQITKEMQAHEAWQFLKFLTMKNNGKFTIMSAKSDQDKVFAVDFDPAKDYIESTKKPAARRDLVEEQQNDPMLGAFAYGNLIAKTWYKKDSDRVESIWAEAIEELNNGKITTAQAFKLITTRMSQMNRQ